MTGEEEEIFSVDTSLKSLVYERKKIMLGGCGAESEFFFFFKMANSGAGINAFRKEVM